MAEKISSKSKRFHKQILLKAKKIKRKKFIYKCSDLTIAFMNLVDYFH